MVYRKYYPDLNPLPIDPKEKVHRHIDALFGAGVSDVLPADIQFDFSRRTGRIKNFSIDGRLAVTLRTDGGLALTIMGAQYLLENSKQFWENCIMPVQEAVPFVSEGRSLFCKHVKWCGSNIKVGSDVAVIDGNSEGGGSDNSSRRVIAVGIAMFSSRLMKQYQKGVAVKVRQGIKGRTE
ncbi:MAG TPA: PUA domain-containing protein [Nitrososphaera sp.]|nr:PUA domain-containing protein [Nitrososphaera sp.]